VFTVAVHALDIAYPAAATRAFAATAAALIRAEARP